MGTIRMNAKYVSPIKQVLTSLCLLILVHSKVEAVASSFTNDTVLLDTAIISSALSSNLESSDAYKIAKHIPFWHTATVDRLASYINNHGTDELERAQIIYCWIALNISYDDRSFNGKKGTENKNAQQVLMTRKALCGGYSELFHKLCSHCKLESIIISGFAKGFGYKKGVRFKETDHAWNAVKMNGKWELIDVTWGSGSGTTYKGKLKSKQEFDDYYFCTPPEAFVLAHLPEDEQYQFLEATLSLKEYEKLPHVSTTLFKLGFSPSEIFDNLRKNPRYILPKTYSLDFPIEGIPSTTTLKSKVTLEINLFTDENTEFVIINNNNWTHFKKEGKKHTVSITPIAGKLSIAHSQKRSKEYSSIIEYRVVR